ncbi:hypothetical protein EI94DRAFT_1708973 [Lactarius quietus]|nr:hypothetical protein EI94DRAFT_1708973 [Lactarius quietus]
MDHARVHKMCRNGIEVAIGDMAAITKKLSEIHGSTLPQSRHGTSLQWDRRRPEVVTEPSSLNWGICYMIHGLENDNAGTVPLAWHPSNEPPTPKSAPMASKTTKVALVTGAARGIGRAIALRLAEDGFDVEVNDVPSTPELDEVTKEIEGKGRRTLCLPADISLEPDVERIVQEVVKEFGSLDVMVANAGIITLRVTKATVEDFDRLMAVNRDARGTMLCYKHSGKQMIAQGRGGRIIGAYLLASFLLLFTLTFGYTRGMFARRKARSSLPFALQLDGAHIVQPASPIAPAYCASKFAVCGLTQAAGTSFSELDAPHHSLVDGGRSSGVCNVNVPTVSQLKALDTSGIGVPALDTILARSPIRRIGRPEEVAGLVSYLASDSAGFITVSWPWLSDIAIGLDKWGCLL